MADDRETQASARAPRVAYVVLTHTSDPGVARLLGAIRASSPDAHIVVAHDSRSAPPPDTGGDPRIEVIEHGLRTDWGSWELVEATLVAFAHVRDRLDPDLVCLISGSDYPARPLRAWEEEALDAATWTGTAAALHYRPRWGRARGVGRDDLTRYSHAWFQTPLGRRRHPSPGRLPRAIRGLRDRALGWLEPAVSVRYVARGRGVHYGIRRLPSPFSDARPCCIGSQWLAVRRPELAALLDRDLRPGSPLRRLYRRSIIPDESALVTPLVWRFGEPTGRPVTRAVWNPQADGVEVATIDDLPEIIAAATPFVRKVDAERSAALLDHLDAITRARQPE